MAAAFGLLLLGAAGSARAQAAAPVVAAPGAASLMQVAQATPAPDNLPNLPSLVPQPHRTLQLDSHGRWGVRLDMEQPAGRSATWQDVQAGAYVSLGSHLRVGGSVGLGDKFDTPQRLTPQDAAAPRVRLETQFRF